MLPDRFILYRRVWDSAKNKWQKYPCDSHGMNIDPHQPGAWMTHDDAAQHATWDESRPASPYGVGFVLNGDGWFLLDLDNATDGNGGWKADAQSLYLSFVGALGEVSTSGTGLHVMGRCDPKLPETHRNKWGDNDREFYTDGRFVALSRDGLAPIGTEYTDKDWTDQLRHIIPEREYLGELPDGRDPAYTGPEDDDELIAMMLRSSSTANAFGGGVTFRDLWEANATSLATKYADPARAFDHSAADAALMSHLAFWTGKDMPRMDRLFRRSALMRDKYDKREDYRRDTVQNAARLCKRVYDKPRRETTHDEGVKNFPDVFLTMTETIEYFKGCVYVQDIHRVLVPSGMLMRPEQFKAAYGGHMFPMMPDGSKSTRNAFEALTECAIHRFPQAAGVCFYPDKPFQAMIDGRINTYLPADVPMREGDPSPFFDCIARMYPDETDRAIITSWMRFVVQNPGKKALWAIVLQGAEGNGKSMISEIMYRAIGEEYCHTARAKEIGGTFNDWQARKMFIAVPEVHMNGRREMLDDLKTNITDYRLPIRGMQVSEKNTHAPTNWMFMSNHRDAVIKSRQDRRYAVFFSQQQTDADVRRDFPNGYFPHLWDWLRDGGYEIMTHWLHNTPPDPRFDPAIDCHRAPRTSSTDAAMEATIGGIEAEILDAVESDRAGFRGGWISSTMLTGMLKEKGFRVHLPKIGQILESLGYSKWGRAPRDIMREGGARPTLWMREGTAGGFDEYLAAQGAGYM